MDDGGLFPRAEATPPPPAVPARFRLALEVPLPRDGALRVPAFIQDVIAFAALSCPDLLGAATSDLVSLWADGIGEERVPSMSAMAWAVARQACGTAAMGSARLTVEPVTVTAVLPYGYMFP